MIKVRLSKIGSKKNKFYRIVALDEQRKRSGKAMDVIGYWHPGTSTIKIDKSKLKLWTEKGAVISSAVKKLAEK